MNLQAVTMVRNEADIWADFVNYYCDLFDKIIIIDHQSTDGTLEITESFVKGGAPIELLKFRYKAYYQAQLSNAIARRCFEAGADWVFFIDADEFINVPNRQTLNDLLLENGSRLAEFKWINLVPTKFGTFEEFDIFQQFFSDGRASRYGKVCLNASWAARYPNFEVQMGNHAVCSAPGVAPADCRMVGSLYHLPIRSIERLRRKLEAGTSAYKAKPGSDPLDGFHWFELFASLSSGDVDLDRIRRFILEYGESLESIGSETPCLGDIRFSRITKHLADTRRRPLSLKASETRELALDWRHIERPSGCDLVAVVTNGEIRLQPLVTRGDGGLIRSSFSKLPASGGLLPTIASDNCISSLTDALVCAMRSVSVPVPSAWTGHVPFLFALISLLHPRRYVELGTHFGMSFFAACEAAQKLDMATQCVAVDHWRGDDHVGYYDETVFNQFHHLLEKNYPHIGYYVRSSFRSALDCFEAGSIDLLHIDGLHTYEAVRDDFESWLPKLSERGVILFHDTTVYKRDFGVWRLWEELQGHYPSFNFLHSHGLGILYVGLEPLPIAELLRQVNSNENLSILANEFFSGLGEHIKGGVSLDEAKRNLLKLDQALIESNHALDECKRTLDQALTESNHALDECKRTLDETKRKHRFEQLESVRQIAGLVKKQPGRATPGELKSLRRFLPRKRKEYRRLLNDFLILSGCPLFEEDWYLGKNKDVYESKIDPVLHYIKHGAREGRAPGPRFDGAKYLDANPDVKWSGLNPLIHYVTVGYAESRLLEKVE
jgi:hypothetical protein